MRAFAVFVIGLFLISNLVFLGEEVQADASFQNWVMHTVGWQHSLNADKSPCIAMNGAQGIAIYNDRLESSVSINGETVARYTSNSFATSQRIQLGVTGGLCYGLQHIKDSTYIANIWDSSGNTILRTTNGGSSWTDISGSFSTIGSARFCLANIDGDNLILARIITGSSITSFNYYESSDSGATWGSTQSVTIGSNSFKSCGIVAVSTDNWAIMLTKSGTSGNMFIYATISGGGSFTATTLPQGPHGAAASGVVGPGGELFFLYSHTSGGTLRLAKSTDGLTFTSSIIASSTDNIKRAVMERVQGNILVASWCEGTDMESRMFIGLSSDLGNTWTTVQPYIFNGIQTGRCTDTQGNIMSYSQPTNRVWGIWQDTLNEVRITRSFLDFVVTCEGIHQDCIFNPSGRNPPLVDVRTSYTTNPSIYTREVQTGTIASDGDIYRLSQDGIVLASKKPCQVTGETSPPVQAKGLAVSFDNRALLSCGIQTNPNENRIKTLHPESLNTLSSTTSIGPGIAGRMDAYTRNVVTVSTVEEFGRIIDPANNQGSLGFELGVSFGGATISARSGHAAMVGTGGTMVFDTVGKNLANIQPIIHSTQITGNAIAISEFAAWIADSSGLRYYEWNPDTGLVQIGSQSGITITDGNSNQGIRLTKDESFLIQWSGTSARIINADTLSTLKTVNTGNVEITGCDVDILNNFLWCSGGNQLFRFRIYDDIPSAFGVTKDGYTEPTNTTFIEAIGSTFDIEVVQITPPAGTTPTTQLPGESGGFIEGTAGDKFFGVDLVPIAVSFDTPLTSVKWLVGLFLIVLMTLALASIGAAGVVLGAFLGLSWATAMGFIPVWVIFITILLLAVIIGAMMKVGE